MVSSHGHRTYSLHESWRAAYAGRVPPRHVLLINCYFDDSRGDHVHAIAGYIGVAEAWDGQFADDWRAILASGPSPLSEFKSSDCRHLAREFRGWDRAEANRVALACLHALGGPDSPVLFGVGVAIHLRADEHSSDDVVLEQVGLRIAFMEIIAVVLHMARHFGASDTVQCICDEQPGLQGVLHDAFAHARGIVMRSGAACRISHLQFEDSKELIPLQAADMLAYETRKDLLNRMEEPQRHRSRALTYLIGKKSHLGWVLPGSFINQMLRSPNPGSQSPPVLYRSSDVASVLPELFQGDLLELVRPPIIREV